MRALKDAHFAEQEQADARVFTLADFRPEAYKQRLYVGPADRTGDRAGEDQFRRGSVTLFHAASSALFSSVFTISPSPGNRRSDVGVKEFIEQVPEPTLEHLDPGFSDRNGVGPGVDDTMCWDRAWATCRGTARRSRHRSFPVPQLRAKTVLLHAAHGEHDMGVGFRHSVLADVPMHIQIGDHALIDSFGSGEVAGTRDGGRWGIGQVHRILTRRTYMGEHELNKRSKTRELKPVCEIVTVPVPPIIDKETFEAVLHSRSPAYAP